MRDRARPREPPQCSDGRAGHDLASVRMALRKVAIMAPCNLLASHDLRGRADGCDPRPHPGRSPVPCVRLVRTAAARRQAALCHQDGHLGSRGPCDRIHHSAAARGARRGRPRPRRGLWPRAGSDLHDDHDHRLRGHDNPSSDTKDPHPPARSGDSEWHRSQSPFRRTRSDRSEARLVQRVRARHRCRHDPGRSRRIRCRPAQSVRGSRTGVREARATPCDTARSDTSGDGGRTRSAPPGRRTRNP